MSKKLAILALFIFVLRVQTYSETHKAQEGTSSQKPSAITSSVPEQQTSSPKLQAEQEKHIDADVRVVQAPTKDRYDKAAFWVNLSLAIVGFFGIGIGVCTLFLIKAQVIEMRRQATLTIEQMDMMVHKDQARLNLDPQPLTIEGTEGFFYLSASIELKNLGESKAHIFFAAGRLAVVPSGQWPLPQPTPDEAFVEFAKTISPSDDPVYFPLSFEDTPLGFNSFLDRINNGDLTIYLYGFIEWETLGIKRCRNFGYTWKVNDPDGIHTAEQIVIEGWWEQDVRQKNGDERQNPN